jgi:outer membrane receptor protein involved in Fe transport
MAFNRFLAAVALAALMPAAATAQTGSGAITGVVKDESDGAVPGAAIKVVNEGTGAAVDVFSNERGSYEVTGLVPGQYRVEAALDGFETVSQRIALEAGQTAAIPITLFPARFTEGVMVTARRVEEIAQEVPIPVSVVSGELVADAGAFNVNRLKEMIPTVQFYSSNPRNSAINIRGLGAPYGLTNDGIEPGVGLYIDGVFHARPASATLDFLDVQQVEVLRGPQGTLFGKNTTAGAINVTTRKPSFTRETQAEINYGSLGLVQVKASTTGPLSQKVAGRLSFSGTTREADAFDRPILAAATVKPEDEHHIEVGVKTAPLPGVTANATVFNTDINDFQAQVVNADVGVLRGYLANAEKVRVRGVEFDGSAKVTSRLSLYNAIAYTDGKYVSFPDAPPPLEETGGPQVKDVSGSDLPGISRWAVSYGGEYIHPATMLGRAGEFFGALDASYRSSFSSSASASRYLVIDGYSLLSTRVGFRRSNDWALSLWVRNLLDEK